VKKPRRGGINIKRDVGYLSRFYSRTREKGRLKRRREKKIGGHRSKGDARRYLRLDVGKHETAPSCVRERRNRGKIPFGGVGKRVQ